MPKYTNNLSVYDFKDICRTCLGRGTMFPLNGKCFGTCLIEMLLSVTFVQFSDEDNLPLQICSKCKKSATRAYHFAQQCLLADSKLQECLKNFQSSKCRKYTNPNQTESKLEQPTEIVEDCSENNVLELQTEIKIEENSDEEINFENIVVKCENIPENEVSSNQETCEMETESAAPNEDEKLVSDTNMEDSDSEPESLLKVDEKKSYQLREWEEATHSENVNPKTKCKICSKLVALHKIDTHICHSKEEFRCEFCGKLFNVKGTLLRHIQTHTGDRLYKFIKMLQTSEENESEEEILCTPEIQAEATAAVETFLPGKSKDRYDKEYEIFIEWIKQNKVQKLTENVLLAYFSSKAKILKSSSLWSKYSMLKMTLNLRDNVDISKFTRLSAFLKCQAVGYKPKKSKILTITQIHQFLLDAADEQYLLIKVALIFGVYGACRCEELCKMVLENIEQQGSVLIVQIPGSNSNISRTFTIAGKIEEIDPVEIYKKYVALRKPNTPHRRFFVNYKATKCTIQPVGIHSFSKMPKLIAKFLQINDAGAFTGHCFRRSSAGIFTLNRHGGWKSSTVADSGI